MHLSDNAIARIQKLWLEATMGFRESLSAREPSLEERTMATNACLGVMPLLLTEVDTLRAKNRTLMRERDDLMQRVAELSDLVMQLQPSSEDVSKAE